MGLLAVSVRFDTALAVARHNCRYEREVAEDGALPERQGIGMRASSCREAPEHRGASHGGVAWADMRAYKASDALKGGCHDGDAFRSVPRLRPAD
jgi:hypothetical protein